MGAEVGGRKNLVEEDLSEDKVLSIPKIDIKLKEKTKKSVRFQIKA